MAVYVCWRSRAWQSRDALQGLVPQPHSVLYKGRLKQGRVFTIRKTFETWELNSVKQNGIKMKTRQSGGPPKI